LAGEEDVIAFLREENRILKARLEGRRLCLEDHERRRLAELGHCLGRQGIGNELIDGLPAQPAMGSIRRRQRVGGLLSYYYRAAA
jgi:hypothetical protein